MANFFDRLEVGRRYLKQGVSDVGVVHAKIYDLNNTDKSRSIVNVYLFDDLKVDWCHRTDKLPVSELIGNP